MNSSILKSVVFSREKYTAPAPKHKQKQEIMKTFYSVFPMYFLIVSEIFGFPLDTIMTQDRVFQLIIPVLKIIVFIEI